GVAELTRRLGASPLVAALAGLTFGVAPTFWARAVEIEAYTLNAAFVVAILYLALNILDLSVPSSSGAVGPLQITDYQLRLCILAFVFGLSLTNHLTTLLLAPPALAAALMGFRAVGNHRPMSDRLRLASIFRRLPLAVWARGSSFVLFSLLLGLSIYLYLPLRWPAVNHGELLSW